MLNGLIAPEKYYDREFSKENLSAYMGRIFEKICADYLKEKSYNGELPFFAEEVGRWWGNNPTTKKQEEIDILALDSENAVLCECEYTEEPFDEKQLSDLKTASECIKRTNKYYWIFSKNGVTSGVKNSIRKNEQFHVVSLNALFA